DERAQRARADGLAPLPRPPDGHAVSPALGGAARAFVALPPRRAGPGRAEQTRAPAIAGTVCPRARRRTAARAWLDAPPPGRVDIVCPSCKATSASGSARNLAVERFDLGLLPIDHHLALDLHR